MQNHGRISAKATQFLKKNGYNVPEKKEVQLTVVPKKKIKAEKPEISYPAGFVGEVAQFICESGFKRQPLYSLAASLCAIGTVIGQRVMTESGMRPNLYCLVVGPTATGKEHPRRMIDRILTESGCDDLIAGDDIASDVGIIDQLSHQPQLLYLIDEFGKFIKRTQSAAATPYVTGILEMLMKLYGLADGTYRGGWTKTNIASQRQVIIQPHVCLYATTTPEQFWPMINTDLVSNGFLNRFFVFQNNEEQPKEQEVFQVPIDRSLIEQFKQLYALPRIPIGADASVPQPRTIKMENDARECLSAAMQEWKIKSMDERNNARDLWKRANDMCRKVALILASAGLSKKGRSTITRDHLEWSVKLVNTLCEESTKNALIHLGKTNHERHMNRLFQKIRSAENGISNRDLSRSCQDLPVKYRNALLAQLVESGQIIETTVFNQTKSSKGWKSVSDTYDS